MGAMIGAFGAAIVLAATSTQIRGGMPPVLAALTATALCSLGGVLGAVVGAQQRLRRRF